MNEEKAEKSCFALLKLNIIFMSMILCALFTSILSVWIYCMVIYFASTHDDIAVNGYVTHFQLYYSDRYITTFYDYNFTTKNDTNYTGVFYKQFYLSEIRKAYAFSNLTILPIFYCNSDPTKNGLDETICRNDLALCGSISGGVLLWGILLWGVFVMCGAYR